jgi:type II secretory pathway pseudopilin PulG
MPIPRLKRAPCRAAGLSRLEIMLCLILIAVLATVLLHRLAELNGLARPARLQAAVGGARAAAAVFRARCQALRAREPANDCALVEVDGVPVAGAQGWPAASPQGIARALSLPGTGQDPFRLRATQVRGTPALSFSLGERGCEFLYVQAKSPDAFPEVDIVDASCH